MGSQGCSFSAGSRRLFTIRGYLANRARAASNLSHSTQQLLRVGYDVPGRPLRFVRTQFLAGPSGLNSYESSDSRPRCDAEKSGPPRYPLDGPDTLSWRGTGVNPNYATDTVRVTGS